MIKLITPVAAFVFVLQFFSIICHKKSLPEFRFPNQIGEGALIGVFVRMWHIHGKRKSILNTYFAGA
jgi:hypothetical protein